MMRAPTRVAALLALVLAPAWAQYKIVAPDGSVTYTDRPPSTDTSKVSSLGRGNAAAAAATAPSALPFELRQVASRYPVTLYASADCPPCDNGRRLLQERGIPYSERRIVTEDDSQALERLVGGRTVPSLLVGAQPLRGFNPTDWASYLDAAGYPRESRLPKGWQAPAPSPLVERVAAPRPAPAPAPATPATRTAPPAPPPDGGNTPTIRF